MLFIHRPKVTKGLSAEQGHQVKSRVSGNGGYRKEAEVYTRALCVKYKCLKTPLNFLGFSGTYGSQLIFISQVPIVLCSVVVFQVQSS